MKPIGKENYSKSKKRSIQQPEKKNPNFSTTNYTNLKLLFKVPRLQVSTKIMSSISINGSAVVQVSPAAVEVSTAVVAIADASDSKGSTSPSTTHSKITMLLSALLLFSAAAFLLLCVVKINQLQMQQDQQQNLLQLISQSMKEQDQSEAGKSRGKRGAVVGKEEEEEEEEEKSLENVLERKDVVYVISDTERTARAEEYKGMFGYL